MNICMFTNTYLPHVGGVANSVHTFAADLKRSGDRVLIITPVCPGSDSYDRDKTNDHILRVPAIKEVNGSDFSMRIPIPFVIDEAIDAFEPHVIHSHHPYMMGDSAFRTARRKRLPLVFTHHTRYEEYVHHVASDADALQAFAVHLSTQYANLCERIISPSQSIARLLKERGVQKNISVIPTGVDTNRFEKGNKAMSRRARHIPESAFVIGHVGRLAPEKSLEYLAQAVVQAIKSEPGAVFMVVGDGPSKSNILNIFKKNNLDRQLIFTGSLQGQELVDAYHAMDVFAFASLSETQGMVLTEAMAAGVPVIARDAPGVRDVLCHDENGIMVDGEASEDAFARRLKIALNQPEKLSDWRLNALAVAQDFTREKSAEQLQDLYRSAIIELEACHDNTGNDIDTWESVVLGLQAEWTLLKEKTKSLFDTIQNHSHDKNTEE